MILETTDYKTKWNPSPEELTNYRKREVEMCKDNIVRAKAHIHNTAFPSLHSDGTLYQACRELGLKHIPGRRM